MYSMHPRRKKPYANHSCVYMYMHTCAYIYVYVYVYVYKNICAYAHK